MCTYIETTDVKILVDPGASLGPRFSLLPHPREYRTLEETRQRMTSFADQASVVTLSHYHFDHATPTFTDYIWNLSSLTVAKQIYRDKLILAKDYRNAINPSQRRRGWMLKGMIEGFVKSFEPADGRTFIFGGTRLRFSSPVPHGEKGTPLGWVLMLTIEHGGERFVHASDIQGPMVSETVEILLCEKPTLVYLGGPPTYLATYREDSTTARQSLQNLERIVENVPQVIVDHHLLRAGIWPESFQKVFATAERKGHHVSTAAQALGLENTFLESQRKELYGKESPSEEFMAWTKLPEERRRFTPTPV